MSDFTWMMAILAVASIVVGIVTTIIVRIDTIPSWKRVGRILCWIIGILLFKLLIWCLVFQFKDSSLFNKPAQVRQTNPVVIQKESWSFSHIAKNGEKQIFELEITKRDGRELFATVQQMYGSTRKNVAGIRLAAIGEDLVGTWVSYLDNTDYGDMRLYKQPGMVWSGQYTMTGGDKGTILCTLFKN